MPNNNSNMQQQLRDHLNEIPFYKAVKLFETKSNLSECYKLFVECGERGNAFALFYIQYLQNNHSQEITKLKDSLIIEHLDYFINNAPEYSGVKADSWLEISKLKLDLQQPRQLTISEQKSIIIKITTIASYCTAAYILLQDITDKQHPVFNQYIEKNGEALIKELRKINLNILDLFLLANMKNMDSLYGADLKYALQIIDTNNINNLKFNGILESKISQIYNQLKWEKTGAYMGNGQLYYKFSFIRGKAFANSLFAGLAGHLYCKVNLSAAINSAGNSFIIVNFEKNIKNDKRFKQAINSDLAEQWLLELSDLDSKKAELKLIEEQFVDQNLINNIIGGMYIAGGKLLENKGRNLEKHNEQESIHCLVKAFFLYRKASKLNIAVGFFNMGVFYQHNLIRKKEQYSGENVEKALGMYREAFKLNDRTAAKKLIVLNYDTENYKEAYQYLQELSGNENEDDAILFVQAMLFSHGLGECPINKELATNSILKSNNMGHMSAKKEIIKDITRDDPMFDHSHFTQEQINKIAQELYLHYQASSMSAIEKNDIVNYLINLFSTEKYANIDMAKKIFLEGQEKNIPAAMFIAAENYLNGNQLLGVEQNGVLAIDLYNKLLSLDHPETKQMIENNRGNIYGKIGIAYMRGYGFDEPMYSEAEKYYQKALELNAEFIEYNLACLCRATKEHDKEYYWLRLAFDKNPNDVDVLYDLGSYYLDKGELKDFSLGQEYIIKAFNNGLYRAIPNYTLIKLMQLFENPDAEINLSNELTKLSKYISTDIVMHTSKDQDLFYILEAVLNLLNTPYKFAEVINRLNFMSSRGYVLSFALDYLKSKPVDRNVNDIWLDLFYLMIIQKDHSSYQELKEKFTESGMVMQQHDKKKQKNKESVCVKYTDYDNSEHKIEKLRQRLASYIHGNSKTKISKQDFKKMFVSASTLFPTELSSKITQGSGSREKFELKNINSKERSAVVFHKVHGPGKSYQENGQQKGLKQQLKKLSRATESCR